MGVNACDVCEMINLCILLRDNDVDIPGLEPFRACLEPYETVEDYRKGIRAEVKRLKVGEK